MPPTPSPPHLSALGDPRGPIARLLGGGMLIVALVVGLLIYGGLQEAPDYVGQTTPALPEASTPDALGTLASLWVDADPSGATVFVDGDSVGVVPLWMDQIAEGRRHVRVVGPDGTSVIDTTIGVMAGMVAELDLPKTEMDRSPTLVMAPGGAIDDTDPQEPATTRAPAVARAPAVGELRVTSVPSGATVTLDDRRIGATPLTVSGLRPGRRSVAVSRRGYETSVRTVDVRAGGVFEAAIDLRPAASLPAEATPAPRPAEPLRAAEPPRPQVVGTGIVEILVRPWGRIEVDGTTYHDATDVVYRAELSAGRHRVVVSHPDFGSAERTVRVSPGSRARIEFDLERGAN